ncbi:MAG: hypothetical protein ACTSRZ_10220 [Promethearchaeota archaeon]
MIDDLIVDDNQFATFIKEFENHEKNRREIRDRRLKRWKEDFKFFLNQLVIPALIYACIGAIAWAVRGSSGFGGFDGTLVPGSAWGILWVYFAYKKGIDGRFVSFWLCIGIAIGGLLGYGIYVSWIQGVFQINNSIIATKDISPIYGYIWFWIVGADWFGVGAIILGWVLSSKVNIEPNKNLYKNKTKFKIWSLRIIIPLIFALIGLILTYVLPNLFYPFYDPTFYSRDICPICVDRVISTNRTNFIFLMWWLGALFTAIIQKDKTTFFCGIFFGVSFGILYMLNAMWTLFYTIAPSYIDWWKIWELGAGFSGGFLYGILQYFWLKNIYRSYKSQNQINENKKINSIPKDLIRSEEEKQLPDLDQKNQSDSTVATHNGETTQKQFMEKQLQQILQKKIAKNKVSAIYFELTNFIFYGIIAYGGSFSIGEFLEFYPSEIDQYSFPIVRILIFSILSIFILFNLIVNLIKISKSSKKMSDLIRSQNSEADSPNQNEYNFQQNHKLTKFIKERLQKKQFKKIDNKLIKSWVYLLIMSVIIAYSTEITVFYALFFGLAILIMNNLKI